MANPYKEALAIIGDGTFDAAAVCLALAQRHPTIFCRLANANGGLMAMVDNFIKEGKKIHAIKEVRAQKEMTLREAKDFVDAREQEMRINGGLGA